MSTVDAGEFLAELVSQLFHAGVLIKRSGRGLDAREAEVLHGDEKRVRAFFPSRLDGDRAQQPTVASLTIGVSAQAATVVVAGRMVGSTGGGSPPAIARRKAMTCRRSMP